MAVDDIMQLKLFLLQSTSRHIKIKKPKVDFRVSYINFIKNVFYDEMDSRLFYFDMAIW